MKLQRLFWAMTPFCLAASVACTQSQEQDFAQDNEAALWCDESCAPGQACRPDSVFNTGVFGGIVRSSCQAVGTVGDPCHNWMDCEDGLKCDKVSVQAVNDNDEQVTIQSFLCVDRDEENHLCTDTSSAIGVHCTGEGESCELLDSPTAGSPVPYRCISSNKPAGAPCSEDSMCEQGLVCRPTKNWEDFWRVINVCDSSFEPDPAGGFSSDLDCSTDISAAPLSCQVPPSGRVPCIEDGDCAYSNCTPTDLSQGNVVLNACYIVPGTAEIGEPCATDSDCRVNTECKNYECKTR